MPAEYEQWRLREILRQAAENAQAQVRHEGPGAGERQPKKTEDQSSSSTTDMADTANMATG